MEKNKSIMEKEKIDELIGIIKNSLSDDVIGTKKPRSAGLQKKAAFAAGCRSNQNRQSKNVSRSTPCR